MTQLNAKHKRTLLNHFHYVDGLLSDLEHVMENTNSRSLFQKYIQDVAPVQRKAIMDSVAHIRRVMSDFLENKGIRMEHPRRNVSELIRTSVTFADITVEELSPNHMRGYGKLSEEAAQELEEIVLEMKKALNQLHTLLQ
ncbi:MAG: hypothetical protein LJE88_01710 [Deltaproteobacteria bacterium]|jgi:hypothetical protein|nr:hypothetical protein [Deltaproteobacteria bacterium]